MRDLAVREDGLSSMIPLMRKVMNTSGPLAAAIDGALRRPDSTTIQRVADAAGDSASAELDELMALLAFADSLGPARVAARVAQRAPGKEEDHQRARGGLVLLDVIGGRWEAARRVGESMPPGEGFWAAYWPYLAILPTAPVPRAQLKAARQELLAAPPPTGAADPPDATSPLAVRLREHLWHYTIGELDARLGDVQDALRQAAAIEHLNASPELRPITLGMAAAVRGAAAFEQGQYARALDELDRVPRTPPLELLLGPLGGERERYLRAESLFHLGRLREALPLYENGFDARIFGGLYAAPCALRLGEIYERLGRPEKAASAYARGLSIWDDPDEPLRPQVAAARQRLARLAGERAAR